MKWYNYLLSLSEFTPFNKIVEDIVLFKKGESTIDLLFLIMESNFNLGKDYFIVTKSNRVLFLGSKEEKIITIPRFLTMDDLDYFFNSYKFISIINKILKAIEG